MVTFISVLIIAYLAVEVWLTTGFYRYRCEVLPEPEEWPVISVLVAARDEEENIAACLESLVNLDYPADKIHIIAGNDQSEDKTGNIIEAYAAKYPQIRLVQIADDDTGLKAKARVMAQLDPFAQGEYYLITDADVQVKPTWAKYMIRCMNPETGVASGTTMVKGSSFTAQMQETDWAYFMGMLNMISYSGVPATAVGNNMIVRSKAYWETGGYGQIRFSITEDYKLYSEVCARGWKWNNMMLPEVLAYSNATFGFTPLLHQRKRWLTGGKALPFYWWILFGVFGLYYFLWPVLLWLNPVLALGLAAAKFGLQAVAVNRIYSLLDEPKPGLLNLLKYEIYLFIVTITTALFFLLPVKTEWKKRKY